MSARATTVVCAAFITLFSGASPGPAAAGSTPIRPDPLAYVAPSRDFDDIHIRLDLDLNLKAQSIAGVVTHTLNPLRPDLTAIHLNCVRLAVEGVRVNGVPTAFDYPVAADHSTSWIEGVETRRASDELVVHLEQPFAVDDTFQLEIRYNGTPKEGLYFIAPQKGIPDQRYEVWSQGEGEDNRYWIPCFDYPNDKATFEGIFRVDKGNYVLSNGTLVETTEIGGKTQYRWRLDAPQVSYLIMVAAGRYDVVEDKWGDIPLLYVVPPGTDRETVRRGFGLTAGIMEFYSNVTGIRYPFSKYAQVAVQDFIYGGMENTSATVMNRRTLYGERAALTDDQTGLIAHELAHQWWGDMVTCEEWSHMWLNEGFATFYQSLYREHRLGDDDFRYEVDQRHRAVVEADNKDPRPLVVDFFNRKDSQNSANVYVKGASVLHMLRHLVGDGTFNRAMHTYGERYKYGLADTRDFSEVFKETTGENLDWFFEQWVYLTGHPDLKVRESWIEDTHMLKLSVAQTQKVDDLTPLFRLPLDVEVTCDGAVNTYRILVDKASQDFYFDLPSKPLMVIFDKGDWTLKTLDFEKPTPELLYQLDHGETMAKVRAARDLAKKPDDSGAILEALRRVMLDDGFWGLRREAALAIGTMGGDGAQAALLEGARNENARVRLAAAEALGHTKSSDAADRALVALLRQDPAYAVQAAAVTALVKMKSGRAEKACLEALKMDSDRELIRTAGLEGLADMRSTSAIDRVKSLAAPGNRIEYRHAAMTAYAKLAKALKSAGEREAAADYLAGMLGDWYLRTRQTAIAALETLGEERAIEPLRFAARNDPVEGVRDRALKAADTISAKTLEETGPDALKTKVQELSSQIDSLQKSLKALERRVPEPPLSTQGSSSAGRGAK